MILPSITILNLLFFLLLSAFFSGSETAFFSINKLQSKRIEKSQNLFSKVVLRLLSKPRKLLITILLGNTFANVAASIIAADIGLAFIDKYDINKSLGLFITGLFITIALVIFGEISPKLYAYSKSEQVAGVSGIFLIIMQYVLFPVIYLLTVISKICLKRPDDFKFNENELTPEDFEHMISSKDKNSLLKDGEKKIIAGIFKFSSTTAKEIMIPRVDIVAVNIADTLESLKETIITSGHSRIPAYKKNIDDIAGIIYSKDLILNTEKSNVSSFIRKPIFITENIKIFDLLNLFKLKKTHMAVVVDEYGGTSGLITLEDVLEELVGEIMDEFDKEIPLITKVSDTEFIINAMTNISSLNSDFNLDLDEEKYDNIAAFLYDKFNKIPDKGEKFFYSEKVVFTILDIENQRINTVKINILNED